MINEIELKQLDKISRSLIKDIEFVEKAFDFTIKITSTFLQVDSDDQVLHYVTLEYATWVFCEFEQNKEKYYEFLNSYFKNQKHSRNSLFDWDLPNKDLPNEDAIRIMDRIDMALNFLKTKLDMELPYELKGQDRNKKHSIRNGGWEQEKLLKRTKSLALSAMDLFSIEKDK